MICLKKLTITANLLKKQFDAQKIGAKSSLESKVLLSYSRCMLNTLTAILNESTTSSLRIAKLEIFLQDNWRSVQGTFLSYTALAGHETTDLLCKVANYIFQEKNRSLQKPAETSVLQGDMECRTAVCTASSLKLLMPTVSTESISDDFPTLEPYFDTNQNMWIDVDVIKVLQTHIISSDGLSLLPVRLFAKLSAQIDAEPLVNPYFDYKVHAASAAYLNDDEYARLASHSSLTQEIWGAKKDYELCLNDNTNLLGHLRQLCQDLIFNSVKVAGAETLAGRGVDAAIMRFNDYYQTLNHIEKDKIPEVLRQKLDDLPKYLVDFDFFLKKIQQGATCVVGIRWELVNAIKGYEHELSAISAQGGDKTAILCEARERLSAAQQKLMSVLGAGSYDVGTDKISLTAALLRDLKLDFEITDSNDLKTIQRLNPLDIGYFFSSRKLQRQLLRQLHSIENLISFFMAMPLDKLRILSPILAPELAQCFLKKPRDLLALCTGLDLVRCQLVCSSVKSSFWRLLNSVDEIIGIFRYIEPDSFYLVGEFVLDPAAGDLSKLFNYADDVKDLLQYLSIEQRALLFMRIKNEIPRLVNASVDFNLLMQYLDSSQRAIVYELVKSKLSKLIIDGLDVSNILQYLDDKDREDVFNRFIKSWVVRYFFTANTSYYLNVVLKYLDNAQSKIVCELLHEEFISIEHFIRVFDSLDLNKKIIFYDSLHRQVPSLIKSASDFRPIFPYLTPVQCKFVLENCRERNSQFRTWDFTCLLASVGHYSDGHRDVIYEILKDLLPQSVKQVRFLLNNFSPKYLDSLKILFQQRLPLLVLSSVDFKQIMQDLNSEQRTVIFALLQTHLPQIIRTQDELHDVLAYLDKDQRTAICLAIKDKLSTLLLSTRALTYLLWILPPNGRKVVYEAVVRQEALQEINDDFLLKIEDAALDIKLVTHRFDDFLGMRSYEEKQVKLNALTMTFELALAHGSSLEINKAFSVLIQHAGVNRSKFFSKGLTRSCCNIIDGIANLQNKQILRVLCVALQLDLRDNDLNSARVIKKVLFDYVTATIYSLDRDESANRERPIAKSTLTFG